MFLRITESCVSEFLQISELIHFSESGTARNPPKKEVRRGIDSAALPAPGAMIFTEQRGIMMMSTGVKSIFENFARFVQFGIDLYRLGLVVQFRIGTLYFF